MVFKSFIIILLLTSCSYKPVYDSRGLQGKDVRQKTAKKKRCKTKSKS
jgi:hypothetical protein